MLDKTGGARKVSKARVIRIGNQTAILDDCIVRLRSLAAKSVDVIVTSPPYNIGVAYNSYHDKQPRDEYLAWIGDVAKQLQRVLKSDGSFFLNVGSTNSDPWIAADVASVFRRYFTLQNNIVWIKSVSIGNDTVGHFKPITSARYLNNNHESIYHFTRDGSVKIDRLAIGVPFKDKTNIARWGHKKDKRCAGNVWFIPYQTVQSKTQKFDHPAGFPVELAEKCIRLHGLAEGLIVLDPFLGAGSTLVAAQRLNCEGIGIEVDPGYAETAAHRLQSSLVDGEEP